jgi:hypothetical protein
MEPLLEVAAHIDGPIDDGLTAEKVIERGSVLDSTGEAIVFEVERHKRASGAIYREGMPMNAYITYWPRYRFDRDSGEFESLEEQRSREFDCDYHGLAREIMCEGFELSVQSTDEEQGWMCTESVGGEQGKVVDVDDVKRFAEKEVQGWNLVEAHGQELKQLLSEEKLDEHFEELRQALVKEARRQAERAWEWKM